MKAFKNGLRGFKRNVDLKTRGRFAIFLLLFLGAFYSCEGQNRPIKIDVKDHPNNGWQFGLKKDTVYIHVPYEVIVHDTTYIDVPYEVVIHDTTYIDKIITKYIHDTTFVYVDVPIYIHDTTYVDKIITIHDTILRDYTPTELKEWAYSYTEADTINVYSDIVHIDRTDGLQRISEPKIYAMIHGEGLREIETDSIRSWQRMYNLERLKTFSRTVYNSLTVPFQIVDVWQENNTHLYATINEKQVRITAWINGELYKNFEAGSSSLNDQNLWEFYFGVPDSGTFKMEVENAKGEIATYEIELNL